MDLAEIEKTPLQTWQQRGVSTDNIPDLLKRTSNWIVWKSFTQKPCGKFDKVPISVASGFKISPHDHTNHLSFELAFDAYQSGIGDGIGFVIDGQPITETEEGIPLYLIGVDLDNIAVTVQSTEKAKQICQTIGSYYEISPSGRGLRIFALSDSLVGKRQSAFGEMYPNKQFLTVTGHGKKRAIIEATDALQALEKQWWPQPPKPVSGLLNLANLYKCYHDTPRQRAVLHDILSFISADCTYEQYRDVVWGILYTNWPDAEDIARKWCETAPERFDESNFFAVVGSYNPNHSNPVTVGTLFHLAKLGGRNV